MRRTIEWRAGTVVTLDQTQLPMKTTWLRLRSAREVAEAIRTMKIRGAPLIGVSAAYALALEAYRSKAKTGKKLMAELVRAAALLTDTRPTAVNLRWAVNRIISKAKRIQGAEDLRGFVIKEAQEIAEEDYKANIAIGRYGANLIRSGDVVLTHCNAGALATSGYGSALGVIRAAFEAGKKISVIASETRPLLQGARLTAYELTRDKIPVTIMVDNAVGYVMHRRMVSKVIVGADRILSTGHVFNKIGTYTISILAKTHRVPFYVAAPTSTIDMKGTVESVEIEERSPREICSIYGTRVAPRGAKAYNPAFDVTPPDNIGAIVTEKGVAYPPYSDALGKLVGTNHT